MTNPGNNGQGMPMPSTNHAIGEVTGGALRTIEKDRFLFKEGDRADCFYKVVSGCLRSCRFLGDGQRLIDAFYFPGDLLGLEWTEIHRTTVEAVNESSLAAYARDDLRRTQAMALALQEQAATGALADLERAQDHMLSLARRATVERVAVFLLDVCERLLARDDSFELPMSRADIGDHLAMSTETVSRVLTQLGREGIVRAHGRKVTLCDRSMLVSLSAGPATAGLLSASPSAMTGKTLRKG
jgi:CRP/FNR family nitrogen fixation transcriptional regulator